MRVAVRRVDLPGTVAGLGTVSLVLLGWVVAQSLTFGIVEHSHLVEVGNDVHHHHPYAGPIALVAALGVLISVVGLFVARMRPVAPSRTEAVGAGRVGIAAAAPLAAALFVLVETVELHRSGSAHEPYAVVVLALGAVLQLVAVPVAGVVKDLLVRQVEGVAQRLMTSHAPVPCRHSNLAQLLVESSHPTQAAAPWQGRAPPARFAPPLARPLPSPTVLSG